MGIVTETGGKTSHSAILARALEIPAVLSVNNAVSQLSAGEQIIVDGTEGSVISSPDETLIEKYTKKRNEYLRERRELENYRGKKTMSASGEEYELFCNIGTPEDALNAIDSNGEGVGLFRTEFLFMDRNSLPDEDEQFSAYTNRSLSERLTSAEIRIFRTSDLKRKKIRLWDSGR